MMKQVILDALNKQIQREMYSSNLYLAMSAYYASQNLSGFAKWMELQAKEEMMHAMKFFQYILQRGGKPVIMEIAAPKLDWESPLNAFEDAYHHETLVTGWINDLVELAKAERDFATDNLLQWFIAEQVEEEATAIEIVEKLKMIGNNPHGIFMMDTNLGGRAATPQAE
ncbi:MAG: ferritin [Candidatus Kapabacteria bacterium]|nr:ferritin [Ignavibacteriota bacterium]MCW5886004.1 ferritin [Candidatus Kapabacteria bacterium]